MSEHWWIDIDWKAPSSGDMDSGKGIVNLAQLAAVEIRREIGPDIPDDRWVIRGVYANNPAGWVNIRAYKAEAAALAALALLRKFLLDDPICIDGIDVGMSMDLLRRKLTEVGKCQNTGG